MPTNERYGRFKVKKIKKRMISAVLALSMGMTLMPTDFTGFRSTARYSDMMMMTGAYIATLSQMTANSGNL